VFISSAYAQAAAGAGDTQSTLISMLPLVLMFVVLYFVMIRPQMKRQKEHKAMIEALAKGDEVVTAGGFLARCPRSAKPTSAWNLPTAWKSRCNARRWFRCCPRARSSNAPPPRRACGASPPQGGNARAGRQSRLRRILDQLPPFA
jgi:preprotein translocase subunit YajC